MKKKHLQYSGQQEQCPEGQTCTVLVCNVLSMKNFTLSTVDAV